MKIGKPFILLAFLMCDHAIAHEIKAGDVFTSPDRHFTVQVSDAELNLKILNNETGGATFLGMLTPCYSFKWGGDSKTFIAIEHIAGGSEAYIFHFNGKQWDHYAVAPAGFDYCDVLQDEIGLNKIKFTFKAGIQNSKGSRFFICSFLLNPETGGRHRNSET